jgi:O-antigen/teichoic acid export membrane protein
LLEKAAYIKWEFQEKMASKEDYFNVDHLKSDLKKRAIRGAGVTVFSRTSTYFIQMFGTMVLARLLTPNDFGLIAMVAVFTMILIEFGMLRLIDATIQSEEINHNQISTLFWINVGLCTGLTVLLIVLSPLVSWFYNEPRLKLITIVMAISFIFNGLSTQHLALLQRNMQFYRITVNEITATTISTGIAIILAWRGWGYWALVAKQLVQSLTTAAGAWLWCRWRPGLPTKNSGVAPMLKFGINSLGSYTMGHLGRSLDKVLIGWRHGAQSLGYYDRAYHLFVMPVNQLTYPLTNVAVGALSRLRNDPQKYCRYYLNAVSMIALIGCLISGVLTLTGNDIILLLLGRQWNEAGRVFSAFGPGIGVMLVYGTHGWLHLSLGRADRLFRWSILNFTITGFFFLIGLPYGALGIAIAYVASFYVLVIPAIWYAGRPINLKITSFLSAIWKYYASALMAGLICWFILHSYDLVSDIFMELNIVARLLLTSALCTIVYLMMVIVLHRNTKPMVQFMSVLSDMVPNIFSRKLSIKI